MDIVQPMSTLQSVTMLSALKITGTKERELSKYLRLHLGKGFCPTQRGVSLLAKGHSKVYTGCIQFMCDEKENKEETVEWTEKDLHLEIETYLTRVLRSRKVQPSDVKTAQAVIGGDHGDTVFQFGASVISVELVDGGINTFI